MTALLYPPAIIARAQERGFATIDSYEVIDAYRTRQRSLGSGQP